jgi:hypothetical protein
LHAYESFEFVGDIPRILILNCFFQVINHGMRL